VKYVLLPFKAAGFVAGVAVLGAGIPLAWVWIASKLSHTILKLPLLPLFVMVIGILVTYLAIANVVARFDQERAALGPPRMSWNRAMTDTRHGGPQLTQWERIFVTTAVVIAIAFEVWFFLFAGSSLPGSGT
jgi:hypothetical protein